MKSTHRVTKWNAQLSLMLFGALFLVEGCGDSVFDVEVPACDSGVEGEPCEVFQIVNVERASRGLAPYEWNRELAVAAQLHAEDMVAQGYFSHTSLDGRSFGERARNAAYEGFPSGENIAAGQRSAVSVMDSWMNSSGHRSNILSNSSTEIGVGLHQNHWVQVFGRQ